MNSTFRREFLTMADKMFHLRANEVRAESRVLMQKLRAERLAQTRHRRRFEMEAAPVASAQPVIAEIRPTASILPSRKIQAAIDLQSPDVVETAETIRPKQKTLKARRSKKAPTALVENSGGCSAELFPVETPAEPAIATPQSPDVPRADLQPKAMPEPTLGEASEAGQAEPKKSKKRKKAARSVADIIEQGLGSVAELQEAVALAVTAAPEPAQAAPRATSPRAKEPIASVPTLGPGMIWRLNQLGIQTLGDLADMDVDDLRGKLGPVAKLVRVENWIAYARAA